MMKNSKGFTLVELIATVSIMAILMIIAVFNIMNIIDKNKRNTYIEDARKLVLLAEHKFQSDSSIPRPTVDSLGFSKCVGFTFSSLVKESELKNGPEGGSYNIYNATPSNIAHLSYVIISYDKANAKYVYSVQLVEDYKNSDTTYKRGIYLVKDSSLLTEENAINNYVFNSKNKTFVESSSNEVKNITGCSSITYR